MTHLSPEQLADIDAVAQHEHLQTCARCRQEWEQQRDVRDLLRALPDPGLIPPDVATGLSAALGRLSPDDVEPAEQLTSRHAVGATVVPMAAPVPHRSFVDRSKPWLAAAAAVVVLGGGGAALVQQWGTGGGDSASTAAGSSADDSSSGRKLAEGAANDVVTSTGTDYAKKDLASQVEALGRRSSSAPAQGDLSSDDTRLATPDGLSSCLSALGVDPGAVTAVDLARFDGEPAAVVVLRAEGGGQDVWVVGRGCRQGDDQTRFFLRVP
jgi:hypothetical protein